MSSFARFFREHLKRFLPLIIGGSLMLTLAGACQGLLIGILRFVFEDNLNISGGADPGGLAKVVGEIRAIPTTLIIGRDGKVARAWAGFSPGRLEKELKAELAR